jgi:MFS superfamily sulfate permease-like transporter/CRP-like cAMP-binding protein
MPASQVVSTDAKDPPARSAPRSLFAGDLSGGLTGGLVSVPAGIPTGLIALAPFGAAAGGVGIIALFLGTSLVNSLFIALRKTPALQAGSPMSIALVIGGAMASIQAQLPPSLVTSVGAAIALLIVLTVVTSFMIAGLAFTGLGALVPMMPFPVTAGIMNATATLVVLTQVRQMTGFSFATLSWPYPGALLVSLVTIWLMVRPIRVLGPVPPVIVALFGGTAVHYTLAAQLPSGASVIGPVLGAIPWGWGQWHAVLDGWDTLPRLPFGPMLEIVLPAAASITLLCAIETLSGASIMQDITGSQGSGRRDLLALAVANFFGGLAGCLPITANSGGSRIVWVNGGRTDMAGFIRAAVIASGAFVLPAAISYLPFSVMAGILVASAWGLVNHESLGMVPLTWRARGQDRAELIGNILVILVVVVTGVRFGMTAAVLIGVGLSLLLFATSMAQSTIRRVRVGPIGRSRTRRSDHETSILLNHQSEIFVIELQGALFFGSAAHVVRQIDAARDNGARLVILDLRRVTSLDVSAARRLIQVSERYWQAGFEMLIASISPGSPPHAAFARMGLSGRLPSNRVFAGLEEAMEHAEAALLAHHLAASNARPDAAEALRLLDLPDTAVDIVLELAPEVAFEADAVVMRTGDASDTLYVLIEGQVDVLLPIGEGEAMGRRRTRLATLMPGTMFGEMALLSGAPRSADAVAHTRVRCLVIENATVEEIQREQPEAAYAIMRAVARHLARNLRLANETIAFYED